ncbi:MAG: PAS domain-containing protein, partial [Bacteroidia bacterium]
MTPLSVSQVLQDLLKRVESYEEVYFDLEKKLEVAQAELDTRLKILAQAALVSETDTRGVITYANDKFCEVSGYTLDELIGKPHNIVRHPDMPKEVFKEMWDTIKSGKIFQG